MSSIRKLKVAARSLLATVDLKRSQAREWNALRRLHFSRIVKQSSGGKVAIVGCGVMGRHIAKSVKLLNGWRVTAACDSKLSALEGMKSLCDSNLIACSSLDELLVDCTRFDVLAVSTTAPSHVPIAIAAANAGVKAILLEKPISNSLKSVDELKQIAGRGCRIAVDHTRRWMAGGDGLKRLIESRAIGNLVAIHAVPGRGGMAMIGTHFFDFARWIVGSSYCRVRAELDSNVRESHRGSDFVDRSGRCEAFFFNGVRLTVDLSDAISMAHGYIVFIGDAGRIEVDEKLGLIRMLGAGQRYWERDYAWPGLALHGVAVAINELVSGKPISCTIEDGEAALEVAIACNLSSHDGGLWVDLPLHNRDRDEVFPFA
jgi:predicted dehydrogenase